MTENIVSALKNRELNIGFNQENFVNINYFNESMIKRMRIEHKISHELEAGDTHIQCGSWNSNGFLLGFGKYEKGVQICKPFLNFEMSVIPVQDNHYLTYTIFMQQHENFLAVCSRNRNSFIWSSLDGLEVDDYVKIWDVEAKSVVRSYSFKGLVKKVATSKALPNHVWFNVDQKTQKIAEADIRSPSYKSMQLNEFEGNTTFLHSRHFTVNPVDEVTIVVSDNSKILFYDRRMMTSSNINHPTKTVDTTSLNGERSYIVQLKYNPSGSKLFITKSYRFTTYNYVAPLVDMSIKNIQKFKFCEQKLLETVIGNPSFLGENHVLFDTFSRNKVSIVYNLEHMRYVGKISLLGQTNYFSKIYSMPHPFCCLIASANQDMINFITPSSSYYN